jgi:hypothetical protein
MSIHSNFDNRTPSYFDVNRSSISISNNDNNDTTNNDANNSYNGFSIYYDDDDDNDESLLVSPILGPNTNMNTSYHDDKENHRHRHLNNTQPTSTVTNVTKTNTTSNLLTNNEMTNVNNLKPIVFTSPTATHNTSSSNNNNKNNYINKTPLSTASSISLSFSSSKHRLRSSARLRRRRELLFSSPMENKFRIEEEDEEEEEEEEEEGVSGKGIQENLFHEKQPNHGRIVQDEQYTMNMNRLLDELETSHCPSLGLGSSIGEDDEFEDEDNGDDMNYNDDDENDDIYRRDTLVRVIEKDHVEQNEDDEQVAIQKSSNTNNDEEGFVSIDEKEQSCTGTLYDTTNNKSLQSLSSSSMGKENQTQANVDNDDNQSNIVTTTNIDSNEGADDGDNGTTQETSKIHSFLNDLEGVVYAGSHKESTTSPKRNIHKNKLERTPPKSSSLAKKSGLSLTPKLKEAAQKALTPVFDAIKSKLHHDQDFMTDLKRRVTFTNEKKKHGTLFNESFKSPPFDKSLDISTSLTPDFKCLKAKLDEDSDNKYNSLFQDSNHDISTIMDTSVQTPGTNISEKMNSNTSIDIELSLTPALNALRSKILGKSQIDSISKPLFGNTPSPNFMTNNSHSLHRASSLFSPPIREPISSRTPRTASTVKDKSMSTIGNESYLSQPKDLSSAKKNLSVQSSVLVERLRGASQRRMVDLTKKRESLAAKESEHYKRQEGELFSLLDDVIQEEESEPKNPQVMRKSKHESIMKKSFKARPLPSTTKTSQIPSILKKPATKAISPKLGIQRSTTNKGRKKNQVDVSSFKARPMPKFSKKYEKGSQPSKTRQVTKPITPSLGPKRKNMIHNQKRKSVQRKQNYNHATFNSTNKQTNSSPELAGLHFLNENNINSMNRENIPPTGGILLHSSVRARARAQFNNSLAQREKEREKQKRIDAASLVERRLQELESLKKTLR